MTQRKMACVMQKTHDFWAFFAFQPGSHDAMTQMTQEFPYCTSLSTSSLFSFFFKLRKSCVIASWKCKKPYVLRAFLHDASRFALRHLASFASWLRHQSQTEKKWRNRKKKYKRDTI
jgi:hypothetical protein